MIKILSFTLWLVFHPVHVTMTSIDLVPDTDSIKVFVRIYYDDFLRDYNLYNKTEYTPDNNPVFPAELMNKYLNEKVIITINNKQLEGKLLNHIILDNEISANLLYRTKKKPRNITVKNLIMTSLYEDQANMVIIRIQDLEEGIKLTPSEAERTFILK
jgi:hypothetical protein